MKKMNRYLTRIAATALLSFVLIFNCADISLADNKDNSTPEAKVKSEAETKAKPMKFWSSQRYGDWTMTCIALDDGTKKICSVKQELKTKEGANVLTILINKQNNSFLADFLLPHGIEISSGAWLIMKTTNTKYEIELTTSFADGFRGQLYLSKGFLENLNNNGKAEIKVYSYSKKEQIRIVISLKGLKESLSKISNL